MLELFVLLLLTCQTIVFSTDQPVCGGYFDNVDSGDSGDYGFDMDEIDKRWPGGVVEYSFVSNGKNDDAVYEDSKVGFSSTEMDIIEKAMKRIEDVTCIRFKRRRDPKPGKWWVLIMREGMKEGGTPECNKKYIQENLRDERIGNRFPFRKNWWGKNNKECFYGAYVSLSRHTEHTVLFVISQTTVTYSDAVIGLFVHELLHTLDIGHTQKRTDRDTYITVNLDNIEYIKQSQYSKCEKRWNRNEWKGCDNHDIPYDCSSIMHYRDYFFAKDDDCQDDFCKTMTAKDPDNCELNKANLKLTANDILLIKKMYCKNDKDKCESGWTFYGNSCYKVFPRMNWMKAQETCRSIPNADLTTITSREENTFVYSLTGKKRTWIGGSDRDNEGTFTWSDGTPWTLDLWAKKQPSGTTSQNCVEMFAKSKVWNDSKCRYKKQFMCEKSVKGVLIVGGKNEEGYADILEEFNPMTQQSCSVGKLPENTKTNRGMSVCHQLVCGGTIYKEECFKFVGNTFSKLPVTLLEKRRYHLCWGLPSGEVLLLGGDYSRTTTERVSADGSSSSPDFNLGYDVRYACGIDLGDRYVVTGGYDGYKKQNVAQYSVTGDLTFLPKLKTGRHAHACSKYSDDDGETILLVTGGRDSSKKKKYLSSTEIYDQSTWSYVSELPSRRAYFSAATVGNSVYVFGGRNNDEKFDEILRYNYKENKWENAGEMTEPRYFHAVSAIASVSKTCGHSEEF